MYSFASSISTPHARWRHALPSEMSNREDDSKDAGMDMSLPRMVRMRTLTCIRADPWEKRIHAGRGASRLRQRHGWGCRRRYVAGWYRLVHLGDEHVKSRSCFYI